MSIDYLDEDVSYLLGMLLARGQLSSGENVYNIIIHFPKGGLIAEGENVHFNTDKEIRLGIEKIRERMLELLGGDIRTVDAGDSWDMVVRFTRHTMAWRNILMILGNKSSFQHFTVPSVFLDPDTPLSFKREFIRGYADVAGNIRPANRDQTGRHRVRLDVLNYPANWAVGVQLCLLLQEHLHVAVPNIIWGHPNLGREWREHQLNIYADEFVSIGFYFDFKQLALQDLADVNRHRFPRAVKGCPGKRRIQERKPVNPEEQNTNRLPAELTGRHFDAYWQICKALGCPRIPPPDAQLELDWVPEE